MSNRDVAHAMLGRALLSQTRSSSNLYFPSARDSFDGGEAEEHRGDMPSVTRSYGMESGNDGSGEEASSR